MKSKVFGEELILQKKQVIKWYYIERRVVLVFHHMFYCVTTYYLPNGIFQETMPPSSYIPLWSILLCIPSFGLIFCITNQNMPMLHAQLLNATKDKGF